MTYTRPKYRRPYPTEGETGAADVGKSSTLSTEQKAKIAQELRQQIMEKWPELMIFIDELKKTGITLTLPRITQWPT